MIFDDTYDYPINAKDQPKAGKYASHHDAAVAGATKAFKRFDKVETRPNARDSGRSKEEAVIADNRVVGFVETREETAGGYTVTGALGCGSFEKQL